MEQCVNLPEDNFILQKSIVYDSSDSVALSRVLVVSTSINIHADHYEYISRTLSWIELNWTELNRIIVMIKDKSQTYVSYMEC